MDEYVSFVSLIFPLLSTESDVARLYRREL